MVFLMPMMLVRSLTDTNMMLATLNIPYYEGKDTDDKTCNVDNPKYTFHNLREH